MNIILLVLARGGSKGVPRKNIRLLNQKPLIQYVIDEAKKTNYPLYVSTEDEEIKQVVSSLEIPIINRPMELAQDNSKSIDATNHAIKELKKQGLKPDAILLLNACCPLTKAEDIQAVVDIYSSEKCDSVVSLVYDASSHPSKTCYLLGNKVISVNTGYSFETGERQSQTKVYKRNTSLYLTSIKTIKKGSFFGPDTRGYAMPQERSMDINSEFDFKLCELLLKSNE